MKTLMKSLAAVVLFGISSLSIAEIVVIVHPSLAVTSLSEDDVSRLFLGKSRSFPNGDQAVPVNQIEGSTIRATFNQTVCKKNASQYKAYWSQLVFTGKGTPPKEANDDSSVKALVAFNPNMIGYVDASVVDASVKVVYKLP